MEQSREQKVFWKIEKPFPGEKSIYNVGLRYFNLACNSRNPREIRYIKRQSCSL